MDRSLVLGNRIVRLFGVPSVPGDAGEGSALGLREVELLAFLALNRHREHPRSALAGVLWSEGSEAKVRRRLNTTVWRLRRAIAERGVAPERVLRSSSSGALRFDPAGPWPLDVDRFERETADLSGRVLVENDALDRIEGALDYYRADLMEGFYHAWVIRERERLRLLFIHGLSACMRHRMEADPERAIALGRRVLEVDPLREAMHREIMRLHVRLGQRTLALRQYEECRTLLREELGIGPMEETRILRDQILKEELPAAGDRWKRQATPGWQGTGTGPPDPDAAGTDGSSGAGGPVEAELDKAEYHLERARRLLRKKPRDGSRSD